MILIIKKNTLWRQQNYCVLMVVNMINKFIIKNKILKLKKIQDKIGNVQYMQLN